MDPLIATVDKPPDFERRISKLRKLAADTRVRDDRVDRYATLLIAADAQARINPEFRAVPKINAENERASFLASMFEVQGPVTLAELECRYARGQKALAKLHRLTGAVLKRVEELDAALSAGLDVLPERGLFEMHSRAIRAAISDLELLLKTSSPEKHEVPLEKPTSLGKSVETGLDWNHLALLWWYHYIKPYYGKWPDMQALAKAWKVSRINDRMNFRHTVEKIANEVVILMRCPPWAVPE